MMRTSASTVFLVLSAFVACSLAAPVLDKRVRRMTTASDLLSTMRSGLSVLSKHSKWRLAQSLNVNCSCLNSDSTESCQVLRSALNATCRLYDANRILPNIGLQDNATQEVLEIMSEKSVEDACNWVNETLSSAEIGSSGLPSSVQCSNVSTLSGICSQWDEFASITTIESKVDRLGSIDINQSKWLDAHNLTEMVDICWQ